MRLRVELGYEAIKEVTWYARLDDFPKLIKYMGFNYEWIMYDKDLTGKVDIVLSYARLPTYDPNYGVICTLWVDMYPDIPSECDCGAKYTSFSWDHMRMCKLWRKW
jgi:hypothetical protein